MLPFDIVTHILGYVSFPEYIRIVHVCHIECADDIYSNFKEHLASSFDAKKICGNEFIEYMAKHGVIMSGSFISYCVNGKSDNNTMDVIMSSDDRNLVFMVEIDIFEYKDVVRYFCPMYMEDHSMPPIYSRSKLKNNNKYVKKIDKDFMSADDIYKIYTYHLMSPRNINKIGKIFYFPPDILMHASYKYMFCKDDFNSAFRTVRYIYIKKGINIQDWTKKMIDMGLIKSCYDGNRLYISQQDLIL
jgi:hypothetical protein